MNKKGKISPSIKYGTVYAEKLFGMVFFIVVIYALFYGIEGGFGDNDNKTMMLLIYFGIISVIMIFIIQITNNLSYIPISISFGCRRKDTFLGTQWINFILFIQNAVAFAGYLLYISEDIDGMKSLMILVYIISIISIAAFGQLVGAISIKYGKLSAYLITGFFIFVLIASGIAAFAFNGIYDKDIFLTDITFVIKIMAVLISCMIYIGSSYFNYRILQKYEVRG